MNDYSIEQILDQFIDEKNKHLIADYYDSTNAWANWNLKRTRDWILDCRDICTKEKVNVDVRTFYVLLQGLVIEIYDDFSKKVKVLNKMYLEDDNNKLITSFNNINDMSKKLYLKHLVETHTILESVRDLFTVEDLNQIIFFRNYYCHPILTGYSIKINKMNDGFDKTERHSTFKEYLDKHPIDYFDKLYTKFMSNCVALLVIDTKLAAMQI